MKSRGKKKENQQRINPRFFISTTAWSGWGPRLSRARLKKRRPGLGEAGPHPLFRPVSSCPPSFSVHPPSGRAFENHRASTQGRQRSWFPQPGCGLASPLCLFSCLFWGVSGPAWKPGAAGPGHWE